MLLTPFNISSLPEVLVIFNRYCEQIIFYPALMFTTWRLPRVQDSDGIDKIKTHDPGPPYFR